MASEKDIIVNLKVEGVDGFKASLKGAEQATDSLETSIKRMEDAIKTVPQGTQEFKKMTAELDALKVVANASGDAFENNRTALAAYKKEISGLATIMATLKAEGKQGTQVFKDIQAQFEATKKKAGELKDKIGDINAEISALGSDTRGIDLTLRGVQSLTAGYQVLEGATGLLGNSNEDLQKQLVKLNQVMAVTSGIQQIAAEATREDSIFKLAAAKATGLYNVVVGQSTGVMKLFKLALASTGIGLVVILVASLIANFDKLKVYVERLFPSLGNISERLKLLKDNIKSFIINGLGTFINSFIDAYNSSQALRTVLYEIGIVFVALGKLVITNAKAIVTVFSSIGQAILHPTKALSILKGGLKDIIGGYKEFGKEFIQNIKEGAEKAADSKLNRIDVTKLFSKEDEPGGAKDAGKKIAQSAKKGAEEESAKDPIELNIEFEFKDAFERYNEVIKLLEEQIKDRFSFLVEAGLNPNEDSGLQLMIKQLKEAQKQSKLLQTQFDELMNPSRATGQLPIAAQGGQTQGQPTLFDRIFGTAKENETRLDELQRMAGGAQKIVSQLNQYGEQIAGIASQAISIKADNELALLEEKKKKGLISEKQYEKESARIKNEAAQKQRAVQIAMAVAKVPEAILSAYISALQIPVVGFTLAPILAGIAGAFAAAQVAIIASSPLPKFRQGGSVKKRLGMINGKKHEQGGVPIEVEGGEYVIKSESVKKYGVKMLDNINAMKFNPVITHSKIGKRDNKLNENLVTISSYLKQGYKIDAQGNQILKEIRDNINKKAVYV